MSLKCLFSVWFDHFASWSEPVIGSTRDFEYVAFSDLLMWFWTSGPPYCSAFWMLCLTKVQCLLWSWWLLKESTCLCVWWWHSCFYPLWLGKFFEERPHHGLLKHLAQSGDKNLHHPPPHMQLKRFFVRVPVLLVDWERRGGFLSLWGSRMSRYFDTMRTEMK